MKNREFLSDADGISIENCAHCGREIEVSTAPTAPLTTLCPHCKTLEFVPACHACIVWEEERQSDEDCECRPEDDLCAAYREKENLLIETGQELNGVIWAKEPLPEKITWHEAVNLLWGTGWRLPTRKEANNAFNHDKCYCLLDDNPCVFNLYWATFDLEGFCGPKACEEVMCFGDGSSSTDLSCNHNYAWPVKEKHDWDDRRNSCDKAEKEIQAAADALGSYLAICRDELDPARLLKLLSLQQDMVANSKNLRPVKEN
jgi:hypothetical protein